MKFCSGKRCPPAAKLVYADDVAILRGSLEAGRRMDNAHPFAYAIGLRINAAKLQERSGLVNLSIRDATKRVEVSLEVSALN